MHIHINAFVTGHGFAKIAQELISIFYNLGRQPYTAHPMVDRTMMNLIYKATKVMPVKAD